MLDRASADPLRPRLVAERRAGRLRLQGCGGAAGERDDAGRAAEGPGLQDTHDR